MPPKLPLKAKTIIKGLEKLGFVRDHASGSHIVYFHATTGRRAVVSNHTGDLPKGTVKAILREAKISLEEFLSAK